MTQLEQVLDLIRRGFSVFPVYPAEGGKCTCGDPKCDSPGKHPISILAPHGFKDASNDETQVREWWGELPHNIGVKTGDGVLVIDVDSRNQGLETFKSLEATYGDFPDTLVVKTSGDGFHAYYRVKQIGDWNKTIGRGIDVKCDGGYVIGPGSVHASGVTYEIMIDSPIADAPDWLVKMAWKGDTKVIPIIAPPAAPVEPVSIDAMRKILSDARRSKAQGNDHKKYQAALLGRILDGEALAPVGERDATILSACGLLAYWLPAGVPWEVVAELFRPSLIAMLAREPDERGLEYMLDVARKKFVRSAASRAAADIERAKEQEEIKKFLAHVQGQSVGAVLKADDAKNWKGMLQTNKQDRPIANELNARILLSSDPELKGTIRFNLFTSEIEVHGGPFQGVRQDVLPLEAAAYCQLHHQFQGGAALIKGALLQVAYDHCYDPIVEYLNELAWDGTERVNTFLETFCNVDVENVSRTYVRAVSRRFLTALVARAMEPGCQYDDMLILEGDQGHRKSSAIRALTGAEYFNDSHLNLGEKDAMMSISRTWVFELGELVSVRGKDIERIKSVLSSRCDKFRPPYGSVPVNFPRRCVFTGTTNVAEYLADPTGNRRFLPVTVLREINTDAIEAVRNQLFAEAVHIYRTEKRWHLTKDEMSLAAVETEQRSEEDPWTGLIIAWMDKPIETILSGGGGGVALTSTANVLKYALDIKPGQWKRADEMRIGSVMRKAGYVKDRPARNQPRVWIKKPPKLVLV